MTAPEAWQQFVAHNEYIKRQLARWEAGDRVTVTREVFDDAVAARGPGHAAHAVLGRLDWDWLAATLPGVVDARLERSDADWETHARVAELLELLGLRDLFSHVLRRAASSDDADVRDVPSLFPPLPTFDPSLSRQARYLRFGQVPIPDPVDEAIDAYLAQVIAGGADSVAEAISGSSEAGRGVLRGHAERLASRAVRGRDRSLLLPALVAALLGGLYRNEREALLPMALVDDASARLRVDAAKLFGQAAGIVGPPGAAHLMGWLKRPAESRTPKAMGYEPSRDSGGFRYRWAL